jgi:hypothetical protein
VASAERADHAPGSRKAESILIAATALPFAGEAETGISVGAVMRKGLQTFRAHDHSDDHGVLDLLRRRGTPNVPSRACPRGTRSTFAPGESTHITHTVTASPILGATDGGIGTSPRTRRHEERWPSVPHLPAGLCCPGDGVDGAVWLAACFLSEGGELSHAARFEGGAREAEANATVRALLVKRGPPAGAGEDRTLEVRARASLMLLQKSTDSARRREADVHHFTRFGERSGTGA